MRFADFPFLRYLPFLVFGILISQNFNFHVLIPSSLLAVSWLSYLWILKKGNRHSAILTALFGYISLLILGAFLGKVQQDFQQNSQGYKLKSGHSFLAEVQKTDVPKPNSSENVLEVFAMEEENDWQPTKTQVLVYHQFKEPLKPGQVIWFQQSPELLPKPEFPNEFDYRGYLAKKGIHYRMFLGKDGVLLDAQPKEYGKFRMLEFRNYLSQILKAYINNPKSLQIATALLLGDKEGMDRDIRDAYSQTGTMHILAVSGLHVGIIYLILVFPLKWKRFSGKTRKGYLMVVITLIWAYAVLTGFSPSVIRAATMFSLVTLGQMRERKPSIWNVLAFSAMLIMSANPQVIYDLGFQLSYLAVAGIVGLQPIFLRIWEPRNVILEYIWQMVTVSFAAQLATFPLTVFYFHLFPTYFLFANLVVVPMAFVSMIAGIGLLTLFWIPGIGWLLGSFLNMWITLQNWITSFFQVLPGGVMNRLTISVSAMALIWLGLVVLGNWQFGPRKAMVYMLLLGIVIWRGEAILNEVFTPSKEIVLYSSDKGTILDVKVGSKFLSWNQDFGSDQISFSIDPDRIQEGRPLAPLPLQGVEGDSSIYFPGLGFYFSPEKRMVYFEQANGIQLKDHSLIKSQ